MIEKEKEEKEEMVQIPLKDAEIMMAHLQKCVLEDVIVPYNILGHFMGAAAKAKPEK